MALKYLLFPLPVIPDIAISKQQQVDARENAPPTHTHARMHTKLEAGCGGAVVVGWLRLTGGEHAGVTEAFVLVSGGVFVEPPQDVLHGDVGVTRGAVGVTRGPLGGRARCAARLSASPSRQQQPRMSHFDVDVIGLQPGSAFSTGWPPRRRFRVRFCNLFCCYTFHVKDKHDEQH